MVLQKKKYLVLGKIKNLTMLHYHLSSQVEKIEGFTKPIERALHLFSKMKEKNPNLDTIDIGGGGAIAYDKNRKLYTTKKVVEAIVKKAKETCDKLNLKHPNIVSEWVDISQLRLRSQFIKLSQKKMYITKAKINGMSSMDHL